MNEGQCIPTVLFMLALLAWKPIVALARPLGANGAALVGYLWVTAVVIGTARLRGIPLAPLFGRPRLADLPRGVAIGLLLFVLGIVGYALTQTLTGAEISSDARAFFALSSAADVALVGGVTVLAVVAEETAFRGILLRDLASRFPPVVAVVICAVLFAAFHMSLLQLASTFVLGAGLAWLTLSQGRLFPALVAHAVYNLLGIGLALLSRR